MMPAAAPQAGIPLAALLVGRVRPMGADGLRSGIAKTPVAEQVLLCHEGFIGDQQGDRRHHGGPEKAVHHYPLDHYPDWRRELPACAELLAEPGAFGENLSTEGLTEADVCIGDVLGVGEALMQVSQPRQPCRTLNARFGVPDMGRRVQESGRTGWYYRVLSPGVVWPGAGMRLQDRPHPDWPLARVVRLLFVHPLDRGELEDLQEVPGLAEDLRRLVAKRLATGRVEDRGRRLG